jgi:hypothetical protein
MAKASWIFTWYTAITGIRDEVRWTKLADRPVVLNDTWGVLRTGVAIARVSALVPLASFVWWTTLVPEADEDLG